MAAQLIRRMIVVAGVMVLLALAVDVPRAGGAARNPAPPRGPSFIPPSPTQAPDEKLVRIYGSPIFIVPPEGFVQEDDSDLLRDSAHEAAIQVAMPTGNATYSQAVNSMAANTLSRQGFKLEGTEVVTKGALAFNLYRTSQVRGTRTFIRWTLVVGDGKHGMLVQAQCPQEQAAAMGKVLKEALASVRWDQTLVPDPQLDAGFAVLPVAPMQLFKRTGRILTFAPGGYGPAPGGPGPHFIVQAQRADKSLAKLTTDDQKAVAQARAGLITNLSDFKLESAAPIKLAGFDGAEVMGTARHTQNKVTSTVFVYVVVLYAYERTYQMTGLTPVEQADAHRDIFKAMARTLRILAPPGQAPADGQPADAPAAISPTPGSGGSDARPSGTPLFGP